MKPETKVYLREALKWLLWTLVGGLLPVWGAVLFAAATSQSVPEVFTGFADRGEIAIYCASLLSPTLYYLLKRRKREIPNKSILALLSVVGICIAVIIYTSVLSVRMLNNGNINFDVIRVISLFLIILSVVLSYWVTVIDFSFPGANIRKMIDKPAEILRNKFDAIVDQDLPKEVTQ